MGRYVIASVSQSALQHNLKQIRKLSPQTKIIAMVKANAYGHGLCPVARSIHNVDAFGVASIEEAMLIRRTDLQTDIVLMEGIFRHDELSLAQSHHLTQVVHHWTQIHALQEYGSVQHKFKVWLKINTGMNRLGFQANEFNDAYNVLARLPQVELLGFMTHFARADERNSEWTPRQLEHFNQIIAGKSGQRCLANSAGILAWPQTHGDWVRPGLMLYGISPFPLTTGKEWDLKPVMSLRSEIIAIREIAQSEPVGYGGTWESSEKLTKIGVVAIGYGDGYPWHAQNGTPVLVNGQRTGLVGRVSMDMLTVDLSLLPGVKIGDSVTLWGEDLPIEEVARHAGTIPYELFCRLTERVTVQMVA